MKKALVAEADDRGSNMNDVALEILATRYGIQVDLDHRRAPLRAGNSTEICLAMPDVLRYALGMAALSQRRTVPREILTALCAHYGIRLPASRAGRRRVAA